MREDIQRTRLDKLKNIQDADMEAYPEKTDRSMSNEEALKDFNAISEDKKEIILVGRIRSLRAMGSIAFAHIEDGSAKIQVFLKRDELGIEKFKLFTKNVELGDFVEVRGFLFLTKQEEKTIEVKDWKLLSKAILPIPTEHFGLKDTEELLRKRYLDLMINSETRELFRKKNVFWQTVRDHLSEAGFLEVQTPVLENVPGGADAEPFITHHNALDRDFFLRISLELSLKRLLVGGYEKVFEIGRLFRNEGIDREHLQEYDDVEFYWAYADLEKGIQFSEELFRKIAKKVLGGYTHEYEEQVIDWEKPFPRVDYFEEFKKETGLNLSEEITVETLKNKADELDINYEDSYGVGRMIDTIYKKTVRQRLIQPCVLVGHPIEVSPLAKRDPQDPKRTLRMQIVAGRSELCNAFAELNDPQDQRGRFEEQMKLREAGDAEAQMIDEDFVEAMEYGMPPAFGFGMSERLFAFLMNRSIRETVIYPPMKDSHGNEENSEEVKIVSETVEEVIELGIDLVKARTVLDTYIKDPITKLHCQESEAIMRGLAKRFGANEDVWGIIGLLHDIDWDQTKENPAEHCNVSVDILKKEGASEYLIETIISHGYGYEHNKKLKDKRRSTKIQFALAAAETLTGLIVASALILPSKKVQDLQLKSLKKKFKNKKFAANCNRETILECEKIGLNIDEFLEIGLVSLQGVSDELGI